MNTNYQLNEIGRVNQRKDDLSIKIKKEIIPAMKNLSFFSHAILFFNDGLDPSLKVGVFELLQIDEKEGIMLLKKNSQLLNGNTIFDIKPYMPSEDRIDEEVESKELSPDYAKADSGTKKLILHSEGIIRKEKGRFFLYPSDFQASLEVVKNVDHIKVLWWFSKFDKKEYRRVTQGEPPYENAPRSGVFATRSPVRPNPIALTIARIIEIDPEEKRIEVTNLDCFDQTPLITIKPYHFSADKIDQFSVPPWLDHWPTANKLLASSLKNEWSLSEDEEDLLTNLLKPKKTTAKTSFFLKEENEVLSSSDNILLRGARQNNLKNINVDIPKGKITTICGASGSGKSSLAFDTLYAESRLRLSENSDGLEKPDLDFVGGLPPAIAIAQRAIGRNPRSTVGTFTGIQDRLRLLFSSIGHRHCPECGQLAEAKSQAELVELLNGLSEYKKSIRPYATEQQWPIDSHENLEVHIEKALSLGKGAFYLQIDEKEILLQNRQMCYHCEHILFEMSPALFSFNNPESMCPVCNGLGKTTDIDPALVIPRPELSLLEGASDYWGDIRSFIQNPTANWMRGELLALAESRRIDLEIPWQELPESFRTSILYGTGEEKVSWSYVHPKNGRSGTITRTVEGVIPVLNRLIKKGGTTAERIVAQYVQSMPCPECLGERLNHEGRKVTINKVRFPQVAALTVHELVQWLLQLPEELSQSDGKKVQIILQDIYKKAVQLQQMGLSYLKLDRSIPTLSGGELQRLKLVAQMGIGLSGLLYVLDEPTAGLHAKDYQSILNSLNELKATGNTVLVVEHEETILNHSDYLLEIGPKAGEDGGQLIWQGAPKEVIHAQTQTADYLSGRERIVISRPDLPSQEHWVSLKGAKRHNLKNIDITFPKGRITCITGVSGSGKSTLAGSVIPQTINEQISGRASCSVCDQLIGAKNITGVIHASQTSIGRSSRSNMATYMGLLDEIRKLFVATDQAKALKLTKSAFSFNSKEGQCDACKGEGRQTISVPFTADIQVICPACYGKRYKKSVLEVLYKEKSIFDILELAVEEAVEFFRNHQKIANILQVLFEVGLGYMKLGQGTGTLSGGEAQRVKLAKALTDQKKSHTLYILDEPTSGLHFSDIQNLLELIARIAAEGHTILIIEHNRHVIRNADWIIDLGPEGGEQGGEVMIQGTVSEVMRCEKSHTGKALLS